MDFIRETLLEGKSEVVFLGKEGRKSKMNPIKTTADFPTTAFVLTQKYGFMSNPFAFSNGLQGNTKTVDMCMVLGMDEVIEPMLEKWRMDLAERGVEIRKKPGQEVHTFDKFMVLGAPTSVPPAVTERQLKKAFAKVEDRVKNDEHGLYDQSLHVTDEPINFSVVKKYPSGMPWVPLKSNEERPNNGRMAFMLLLKENQEQRMRNVVKEIKDTSGLTKHVGRNAWMMEMQSNHKASDSMEIKRIKDKTIEAVYAHGSMMLSLGQAQIPGLYNINKVYHLRQVDRNGKVRTLKKSIDSILDYLKWDDERVFQSVWEMEDGSVLAFFSTVIQGIETYVDNWMMCPAANLYWFLIKKRM